MEEQDVIFIGNVPPNNSALTSAQENGEPLEARQNQLQLGNHPQWPNNGNEANAGFYGVLPQNYFQQPPGAPEFGPILPDLNYVPYNTFQGPMNTYENPPQPAFQFPQGFPFNVPKFPDPIPLRRNPSRSRKKVSPHNEIGPNGFYVVPPRNAKAAAAPKTAKAAAAPKAARAAAAPKTAKAAAAPKTAKAAAAPKAARAAAAPKPAKAAAAPKPAKAQKAKAKQDTTPRKRKYQRVNEEPAVPRLLDFQAAVPPPENGTDYHRLLDLQNADLVPSPEAFDCPKCGYYVPPGTGVVLKDCLHSFCWQCLESTVRESMTAQVRCPFKSAEYECESHLQEREVKSLVCPEDYDRHVARSVQEARLQADNVVQCVRPSCPGWYLLEEKNAHVKSFVCQVCLCTNCLACRVIHDAMGCPRQQYATDFLQKIDHNLEELKEIMKPFEEKMNGIQKVANYLGPATITKEEMMADDPAEDYTQQLRLYDQGLAPNAEDFQCPICFGDFAAGEGVTLKDCLHNFCAKCLESTILHSETVIVKCPFMDDYTCESFLQDREIKYLLKTEDYERHLAMGLALAERQSANSFHCKTPDCAGWCYVDNDADQFYCQVCHHINCLACAAIHEGKNCKQYQDLAALESDTSEEAKATREYLEKQLVSNKAMKCPTCCVIVMKRDGCDWLVCAMCKTEICWATRGPRWGPGGKGDTSGGCNCDFRNGRPCHPKCYNCH